MPHGAMAPGTSWNRQRANLLHSSTPTAPQPALPHPAHTDAHCLLRHQQLGAQVLPNCPPTHGAAQSPRRGWGSCCPPTATPSPMANSLRSPSALMSHQHQDKKGWQSQRMLIRGKASLKQNRSPKGAGGGQESTPQGTEVLHLWAPRGAVVGCIAPHGAHGMDCCALQSYRCRAAPG